MKRSVQNLVKDIKLELLQDDIPVSSVLRKALVLACELGDEELQLWVNCELDGYGEGVTVPEYRHCNMQSFGNFVGCGYAQMTNMVLPPAFIPKEYHYITNEVVMRENLRAIETCLIHAQKDINVGLRINWPGDLVALLAGKFYRGFSLVAAWVFVQPSDLFAIVDTVRNRLLRYVLAIDSSYPQRRRAIEKRTRTVFNTTILGASQNTNIGVANVSQTNPVQVSIPKGDWNALGKYINGLGVSDEEIQSLRADIESDSKECKSGIGPRASSWLERIRNGTVHVASSLAGNVVANLITQAIVSFLGS